MNDSNLVLPNFMILGAAKAGTTTLCALLSQHPQIYVPSQKELHFFDSDEHYAKGLAHYSRFFQEGAHHLARGEATPAYLRLAEIVAPRMRHSFENGPIRFIVVFRDPVQRAWSHYLHAVRSGIETKSFEEAIDLESSRLKNNAAVWLGYYRDGLYARQMGIWLRFFSKDQFLILLTDDLSENPCSTEDRIWDFLQVDHIDLAESQQPMNTAALPRSRWLARIIGHPPGVISWPIKHVLSPVARHQLKRQLLNLNIDATEKKPVLDPAVERALRAKYASDVVELSSLIGRDLTSWLP